MPAEPLKTQHEIVYRAVDTLIPYDRNARLHSVAQVNKIARSIRAYGFNNPILVDAHRVIVAGHGRLRAAKVLGLKTVPVIELGHLTDAQRRAYTLADNRTADDATWDKGLLSAELAAIAALSDVDFDSMGFADKEIEKLLGDVGDLDRAGAKRAPKQSAPTTPAASTTESPVPAVVVAPPEALVDGRVNLWCGDCLDVLKSMPADSVDAIVSDPPYGLGKEPDAIEMLRAWLEGGHYEVRSSSGFMGKEWDSFVPQPAVWKEALRVLKPGGHIVAFFGTRTYDLGVLAIRLAGFEVRDLMSWLYGQGFPKSLDVGKAVDKLDTLALRRQRALEFTAWMRGTGVTAKQINDATGTNMASHYLTDKEQPAVATRDQFELLRPLFACDVPPAIEALVDARTVESENMKRREVVGEHDKEAQAARWRGDYQGGDVAPPGLITVAHSEAAQQWEGWGTALKPACEPIVLARKPLAGAVAENVLAHGTGALNIAACRVGDEVRPAAFTSFAPCAGNALGTAEARRGTQGEAKEYVGRWPANVIHDGSAEVVAAFPEQSSGGTPASRSADKFCNTYGEFKGAEVETGIGPSNGTAARFFYTAKADADDRIGSAHPTVKPVDLMQWLVRLVTPPGGLVLDPFAGTGTTGEAAIREGLRAALIEREPEYQADIRRRLANVLATESERARIVATAKRKRKEAKDTAGAAA